MKKYFIYFGLLILINSCTVPVFITKGSSYNGGDTYTPASIENNVVKNVEPNDTVIFYKGSEGKDYLYNSSSIAAIYWGYTTNVNIKDIKIEKKPNVVASKTVSLGKTISGVAYSGYSSLVLDTSKSYMKSSLIENKVDIHYTVDFVNKGNAPANEIIFIDALPSNFEITSVSVFKPSRLMGIIEFLIYGYPTANYIYKEEGYKLSWEIKNKNGINYLIVKIDMKEKPMTESGLVDSAMQITIDGKLTIN